jgi:hypothetical protein
MLGVLAASALEGHDPRETAAREKCLAGDTQEGVALLANLYVETRDPTYVYNQARCFQQNGRNEQAAFRFREYLRLDQTVSVEERTKVEGYIRELEPAPAPRPAVALAPVASPPAAVTLVEPRRPESSSSVFGRWWFWTLTGAVVAGTAAALVLSRGGGTHPACPPDGICPR